MLETFTLVFWVTIGWRFEEMRLPDLYTVQCTVFRDEMLRERAPVRAECVADPPRPAREIRSLQPCATGSQDWCGGPLPGRRRV